MRWVAGSACVHEVGGRECIAHELGGRECIEHEVGGRENTCA